MAKKANSTKAMLERGDGQIVLARGTDGTKYSLSLEEAKGALKGLGKSSTSYAYLALSSSRKKAPQRHVEMRPTNRGKDLEFRFTEKGKPLFSVLPLVVARTDFEALLE